MAAVTNPTGIKLRRDAPAPPGGGRKTKAPHRPTVSRLNQPSRPEAGPKRYCNHHQGPIRLPFEPAGLGDSSRSLRLADEERCLTATHGRAGSDTTRQGQLALAHPRWFASSRGNWRDSLRLLPGSRCKVQTDSPRLPREPGTHEPESGTANTEESSRSRGWSGSRWADCRDSECCRCPVSVPSSVPSH